jgi:hypothetical protein
MTPNGSEVPAKAIPEPVEPAPDVAPPQPAYRWYHRATAVLFATFCLEIGFFLLVFPWTDYATDFAAFRPEWRGYWDNPYVRGAISGLGMVNLYIAVLEIIALRRVAKH